MLSGDIKIRNTPTINQISRLEAEIKTLPQQKIKETHHFSDGIYAREIFIPAGTVLTGKIHKTEHLNIISKGCIVVWTEEGMRMISAPFTLKSNAGTKRAGYALQDTIWTTIHSNPENSTDLIELEEKLIQSSSINIKNEVFPWLG